MPNLPIILEDVSLKPGVWQRCYGPIGRRVASKRGCNTQHIVAFCMDELDGFVICGPKCEGVATSAGGLRMERAQSLTCQSITAAARLFEGRGGHHRSPLILQCHLPIDEIPVIGACRFSRPPHRQHHEHRAERKRDEYFGSPSILPAAAPVVPPRQAFPKGAEEIGPIQQPEQDQKVIAKYLFGCILPSGLMTRSVTTCSPGMC